jgi:hypothetical protein
MKSRFNLFAVILFFLFSLGKVQAGNDYLIKVNSDKDQYEFKNTANFLVEITTDKKSLKDTTIKAFFPDAKTEVSLTTVSDFKFKYVSGVLSSLGEKTLTVHLYKKQNQIEIDNLEKDKSLLIQQVQFLQKTIIQNPILRQVVEKIIALYLSLISQIESKIAQLKQPIAQGTKTIRVADTKPPVFEPLSDIEQEATGNETPVTLPVPKVTDECDPSPKVTNNAPPAFPIGVTLVTFTAMDFSGNSSHLTIKVTIRNSTPDTFIIDEGNFTSKQAVHLSFTSSHAVQLKISESSDFSNSQVFPFASKLNYSLSGSDGLKTLFVKFIDANSQETILPSKSIELDTVVPITEMRYPQEGYVITPKA